MSRRPCTLRIALLLAALACAARPVPAAAGADGGTRSVFAFGAGNRALALGGGYVAAADDASALIWNPGGLAALQRSEFQLTDFRDPLLDVRELYGAFALPSWRWGTLGIAARHFGTGGIEARDDQNVPLPGELSFSETELTLGYGRSLGDAVGAGATFKLLRQSLGAFSASAIGMDVGVSVRPAVLAGFGDSWAHGLRWGLTARNAVEPAVRLDRESVPDPATLRTGLAFRTPMRWGSLLATADVERSRGVAARLHTGLEIVPSPGTAARLGLDDGRLTAGVGMRWRDLSLDYTYMDRALQTDHRVGVTLQFGATVEDSRLAARKAEDDALQQRLAEAFRRQQQEQVTSLIERAERERASGRFDQALETLLALATLAPEDPRLPLLESRCLLGKAAALEQGGDFAAAAMTYELAAQSGVPDTLAITGAARCRAESDRRARRSELIRREFARALDAFTLDDLPAARAGFAAVLAQDSLDADARAMLRRTVEAARRRADRLLSQAAAAVAAGAFGEAPSLLDEAARLDPEEPRLTAVRVSLVRARAAAAEAPAAAAPPRVRSAIGEAELEALYRRGLEAARRGGSDDALRYWEIVWSSSPGYRQVAEYLKREYLTRGMEAFAAGRLEEAVTQWRHVLRVDPNDARASGYLARAQQQMARSREILGATP